MKKIYTIIFLLFNFTLTELNVSAQEVDTATSASVPSPRTYGYKIINTYPHDPQASTQGLEFRNGYLYEGTGIEGRSTLRKVELKSGKVIKSLALDPKLFGEGITIYKDSIIQLTWRAQLGFVYDLDTFRQRKTFRYPTEGWGITTDGKELIMSDGTATLYFLDPQTFKQLKKIMVSDRGRPVIWLNELEYVNGYIYANVMSSDKIAIIDPESGKVNGWVDLAGLACAGEGKSLNGIAYDQDSGNFFVTGKLCPALYQIELIAKD